MITHTVFFWLKPELTAGQRAAFEQRLRGLLEIPGSTRAVVGKPAATAARPVLDHSYDFALELDFPDVAAHDVYQDHPVHLDFVAAGRDLWLQVKVYDFEQFTS